jgi:hypothetical protein
MEYPSRRQRGRALGREQVREEIGPFQGLTEGIVFSPRIYLRALFELRTPRNIASNEMGK